MDEVFAENQPPLWSVVDGALCWKGADTWSAAGLAWALDDEGEGRPTPEDCEALIAIVSHHRHLWRALAQACEDGWGDGEHVANIYFGAQVAAADSGSQEANHG